MTLFKQLYIGTIAVLLLTALLLTLTFNYYVEQDNINDFLDDIEQSTSSYHQKIITPENQLLREQLQQTPDCQRFCVSWLAPDDLSGFTRMLEPLQETVDATVYEYPNGCQLAVVYAYPDLKGYVLISDRPHHDEHCHSDDPEMDNPDLITLFPWLYILLGAMGVASILFFLSNRIERAIRGLQSVVSGYADNPAQRADENTPEPVRQLAGSFNQLADQLDEQHQEQQVMTHAIAHELRTPLARMRLALGMVDTQALTPQTQALLDDVDRYVTDMDQLTKDVLLFGRLNQQEKVHTSDAINFSMLLEQRLTYLASPQRDKIRCTIQPNIHIYMIKKHLQVLIDNLINNALAYANSTVSITLEQRLNTSVNTRPKPEHIYFCVQDDGAGIDEAHISKLFVPFYRADESRDRKTGGFGLGLAIVHAIVKQYGGEISATNAKNGGAVFTLLLHAP